MRSADRLERRMKIEEIINYIAGYKQYLREWAKDDWKSRDFIIADVVLTNLMASFYDIMQGDEK